MMLRVILVTVLSLSASAMACDITPLQIQDEALAFLKKEYPNRDFARGKIVEEIDMGKVILGLQNLRSKFCTASQPPNASARQEAMREHFQAMMVLLKDREPVLPHSWAQAKGMVTVQFMPTDYLRLLKDTPLVTRSFAPGVELGVVIENKDGYGYVRQEDRLRWKVEEKALFETALKNLDLKNTGAKLRGGGDPDRFLAIEEKDGYDAVRLLLPWVRQEASKFLGDPFMAAIPNRDFLIMWSTRNASRFQQFVRGKVEADFKAQPYPLSPGTLRVWANGRIEVVP